MKPTMEIAKESIRILLEKASGTIFNVVFEKKNGETRSLNGRLHVTKFLKGGENTTAHIEKYITVYDLKKEGYRNVNIETVKELDVNGIHYTVK